MSLPLSGIKVLDLTHAAAGPYAAMVLGDLGADIVKVESMRSGDHVRNWGIKVGVESTFHLSLNRNKRSVLMDFRAPEATATLRTMADNCDVLLENFRAGVIEKMGLGYEVLKESNPRLVFGSVSGFGRTGPRAEEPGFDLVAQALSGVMSVNGTADGGPLRVGLPLGDLGAGLWLALGVVAAIRQRDQTGRGQRVESSLLATMLNLLSYHSQAYLTAGVVPGRTGNAHSGISPYGAFQAQDELMVIAPAAVSMWAPLCKALGLEHLIEHEDFSTPQKRVANVARLKVLIEEQLATNTAAHWSAKLVAAGIPAGQINTVDKALEEPQVQACGLVETIPHPTLGSWRSVGSAVLFSEAGGAPSTRLPPPDGGEHSIECLKEFGVSDATIDRLLSSGAVRQSPARQAAAA